MNDTTVRPFMYEQVTRNYFIQFICGLAASLKFNSLAIFVVDVDGVGYNRYFSSSVFVVVDNFIYYGNYFVWILLYILWIWNCLGDCGYYFISCWASAEVWILLFMRMKIKLQDSAESETEMKFCAIRSDEARARRKATKKATSESTEGQYQRHPKHDRNRRCARNRGSRMNGQMDNPSG